jgi:cobalt transporter subunit CbtA
MNIFRSIVFAAALTGVCVGVLDSAADYFGTGPLILQAEVFEQAGEAAAPHDHAAHDHGAKETAEAAAPTSPAAVEEGHHDDGGWEPADGLERTGYTLVANILTAFGYALVLTGIFSFRGKPVSWRDGLLFGLAAFAAVMVAPALGLPPELPGTPAGPLADRQLWWVATALCTAAGLWLIAFVPRGWAAVLAIVLFVAPHLYGAPQPPEGAHALAPEALQHRFVVVATITSLIFWSALGVLAARFFSYFSKADA